jgi:hypothetical protein
MGPGLGIGKSRKARAFKWKLRAKRSTVVLRRIIGFSNERRRRMRWGLILTWFVAMQPGQSPDPPGFVALLEDVEPQFFARLNNDGSLDGSGVGYELRDVYSGAASVRVTPHQRFCSKLPGWNFEIAEQPVPGQFRYIRFAWKRIGGDGIMIQLHNSTGSWNQRFLAGKQAPSTIGWGPMLTVRNEMPRDWTVETRDLFKDFGAMTITGMALTPMEGGAAGLFDHMYLGRTIEDLDRATRRQFAPDSAPWKADAFDKAWEDLGVGDAPVAGDALRLLLSGRDAVIPLLKKKLDRANDPSEEEQRIRRLISDLQSPVFKNREKATAELWRAGPMVVPALRAALRASEETESRRRIEALLNKFPENVTAEWPSEKLRKVRTVHVLEWIGTDAAHALLEQLTARTADPELAADAREALGRRKKR